MALPAWLKDREEQGLVSTADLIMVLPELSLNEWEKAASQYLRETTQLVFYLQVRTSEAEKILDQAAQRIQEGHVGEAEPLVRGALVQVSAMKGPVHARTVARLALMAGCLDDDQLMKEAANRAESVLGEIGAIDVAGMTQTCHNISSREGPRIAYLFAEGVLASVDARCVEKQLHTLEGRKVSPFRSQEESHRLLLANS